MLCNSCGSRGIHGLCRTVKKKRSWTCPDCQIDNTRPVSPVSPDVHGASGQPALSQCCESSSDVIIIDDDDETPPEVEPETRREPSQSLTGAIRKRFRQDAETLASCSQQVDGFIVKRARSLQTTFTNVSDRIFSNKENHMDSERGVDAVRTKNWPF